MLSALLLCVEYWGVRREGDCGGGRDCSRAVKRSWRSVILIDGWIWRSELSVTAAVEGAVQSKGKNPSVSWSKIFRSWISPRSLICCAKGKRDCNTNEIYTWTLLIICPRFRRGLADVFPRSFAEVLRKISLLQINYLLITSFHGYTYHRQYRMLYLSYWWPKKIDGCQVIAKALASRSLDFNIESPIGQILLDLWGTMTMLSAHPSVKVLQWYKLSLLRNLDEFRYHSLCAPPYQFQATLKASPKLKRRWQHRLHTQPTGSRRQSRWLDPLAELGKGDAELGLYLRAWISAGYSVVFITNDTIPDCLELAGPVLLAGGTVEVPAAG